MFDGLFFLLLLGALAWAARRIARLERRVTMLEAERGMAAEMLRAADPPAPNPPSALPSSSIELAPASIPLRAPDAPPEEARDALTPAPGPPEKTSALSRAAPLAARFAVEDLFGRRLPIWAGGITLAVAGILIVRYSIDAGLLSPAVRVLLGLLFGAGLIAAAEVALRQEARLRDARVRQALAGAGTATLYASVLIAANLYGLIGQGAAFLGLAAVTALAMAMALRFGAPSALLGLIGGLAAPALVGAGEPDVALLSGYLALTIGGLCALSRTQRWMWLGIGALIGGAGWSLVLVLLGTLDAGGSVAIGMLVLATGLAFPMLAGGSAGGALVRPIAGAVAAAQMALIVATGGFTMLNWGLFGLLSVAILRLAARDPALRQLPAIALGIVLLIVASWPAPGVAAFATVMLAIVAIYGATAMVRLWHGRGLLDAGIVAATALAVPILAILHFRTEPGDDAVYAALALGAACLPAAAAAWGWQRRRAHDDARMALLATVAASLLAAAALLVLPGWTLPAVIAIAATGLLMLAERAGDRRMEGCAWALASAGLMALVADARAAAELARLWQAAPAVWPAQAVARWGAVTLMSAMFAWRGHWRRGAVAAQMAAAVVFSGMVAQIVALPWLPAVIAGVLVPLGLGARRLAPDRLMPALATLTAMLGGWALLPVATWSGHALVSLIGYPMLASELGLADMVVPRLALPAAGIAAMLTLAGDTIRPGPRRAIAIVAAIIGGIGAHILYKQLFALSDHGDFVRLALAERTLWQALLLAAAVIAWRLGRRGLALFPLGAALAHALVYTVALHDPIWADQMVGAWPVANLLLPAFGVPLLALAALGRITARSARRDRAIEVARIAIVTLFAFATLRQFFHGSLLTAPGISAAEDIGRSVLAIALAIGFLIWGIRRRQRAWRIASLVLMLGAVGKVFLLDTSGLDGLLRIASFAALGFSLIGIGWLYSRELGRRSD